MMGKKLRNLALLGGLGAAAYMMGSKKGDSKKDVDTTADASAGRAKDRLGGAGFDRGDKDTTGDMSAGQAKDRLKDLNVAPVKKAKKKLTLNPLLLLKPQLVL
jgi:predicted secreted protein